MNKLKLQKISSLILLFVLAVITVFSTVYVPSVYALTDNKQKFEQTNVLDDLKSDKNFNLSNYLKYVTIKDYVEIINFVEFGYSENKYNVNDFGLYIYLYNPNGYDIKDNGQNKVQISTKKSSLSGYYFYKKYNITLLSSYDDLFYKFRIEDASEIFRDLSSERSYSISGIELNIGGANAQDFNIGGEWVYTGYANGYGDYEKKPLTCKKAKNDFVIELDVRSTNYLTQSSSKGELYRNNISSVYFSVPNKILKDYGNLQKISCEWYEVKTTPILLTSDYSSGGNIDANYEEFKDYLGKNIDDISSMERFVYEYYQPNTSLYPQGYYGVVYGKRPKYLSFVESRGGYLVDPLTWLFPVSSLDGVPRIRDKYNASTPALTGEYLIDYALKFKSTYGGALSSDSYLAGRGIGEGLFNKNVDEGRSYGKNTMVFDANDSFDILDYDSNHSGWERFWTYFWKLKSTTNDGRKDVKPIVQVDKVTTADDMLINSADFDAFKTYNASANAKDETTILFRFAQTDYKTNLLTCETTRLFDGGTKNMAYVEQTAFLDFDVIELTFTKDGVSTVFACVSNPIDVMGDVDLGPKGCAEYFKSYMVVLGFLGVSIVAWRVITKHFVKRK